MGGKMSGAIGSLLVFWAVWRNKVFEFWHAIILKSVGLPILKTPQDWRLSKSKSQNHFLLLNTVWSQGIFKHRPLSGWRIHAIQQAGKKNCFQICGGFMTCTSQNISKFPLPWTILLPRNTVLKFWDLSKGGTPWVVLAQIKVFICSETTWRQINVHLKSKKTFLAAPHGLIKVHFFKTHTMQQGVKP